MSGLIPYDIAVDAYNEARAERNRQLGSVHYLCPDYGLAEAANAVATHVEAKSAARIAVLENAFIKVRGALWLAQNEYAGASPHSPFVKVLEETRELAHKLNFQLTSIALTGDACTAARIAALEAALTPSADTKAAYSCEVSFGIPDIDEDGDEVTRDVTVPWTTIKDIMKMIREHAAPNGGNS